MNDNILSRHIYYNLIRVLTDMVLLCIFVPASIILISSILIDNQLSVASLIVIVTCFILWVISIVVLNVLNKYSKNKIVIYENKIKYNDKTMYKDNISIKYFKLHISLIDEDLVFPKIHINSNGLSYVFYLSRKDVIKMKKHNYIIREI